MKGPTTTAARARAARARLRAAKLARIRGRAQRAINDVAEKRAALGLLDVAAELARIADNHVVHGPALPCGFKTSELCQLNFALRGRCSGAERCCGAGLLVVTAVDALLVVTAVDGAGLESL